MASAVKVAVRLRPINKREAERDAKTVIKMSGKQTQLINPSMEQDIKKFTFDFSYDSSGKPGDRNYTTQLQVYKDLGIDVVTSVFEGYNACVFAYGQTGSGKSYSMMGYGEKGLIPRICEGIFARSTLEKEKEPENTYIAEVNYLEIYNEKVRDLLVEPTSKGATPHALKVRENPKTGPFVEGLTSHKVLCYEEILALMDLGNEHRTTAATNMNDTSSRSHAVFTMVFTQASVVQGIPCERTSKINLVDLAGSERTSSTGATGLRLKEGGNINKSLTTLGLVISALAERSKKKKGAAAGKKGGSHVPYRDSALTWLLRESLGGNSKTIMLAAISPADINYGETLSTLHYANRAKNIMNKAIVNEDENVKLIKELQAEVARLKDMLGGDEEIAKLQAGKDAARAALAAASTDEERAEAEAALAAAELAMNKMEKDTKMLEKSEGMMSALTDSWKEKWQIQTKVMEDRELSLADTGKGVRVESKKPNLISLNLDDALSTGVTMFYLDHGETKMGREGTVDKMGTEPDIPLVGEDILPEHCVIINTDDEKVEFRPIGPNCQVNGMAVTEICELQQGTMVVLGRDNMFRFNHPVQASRLRSARASGADSASSTTAATPNSGSGVFSLGQIFEDRRKQELSRLEATREKLEGLEKEKESYEIEREASLADLAAREELEARRKAEQDALVLRMKEMEDQIAEDHTREAELAKQKEAEEVRAKELAVQKEALEAAKRESDLKAKQMEAELAALAEEQKAMEVKAEEARAAAAALATQREEAATAAAAQAEKDREAAALKQKERDEADRINAEKAAEQSRQLAKEREEAKRFQQERDRLELESKRRDAEMHKLKQEQLLAQEELDCERAEIEAAKMKALEEERARKAKEAEHRRKVKRLETATGHADRVHSLARSHTTAFSAKAEKSEFDMMWGIRVPRYHDKSESGKSHIVFEVKMACRGEEWTIYRRYSQFESLHKRLKKTMPGLIGNIKFPPKKWKADAAFLMERRLCLETYLRVLIEMTHNNPSSPFYRTSKRELEKQLPFFKADAAFGQ